MIALGNDVLKLIPQRPPIVMVDKLISAADKKTLSGLKITPENIFVEDNCLQEPGIIENIAQSAALGVGYLCQSKNEKIPIGFIGAVSNLKIFSLPKVNTEITTEIQVEYEVMETTLISSKVFCNEQLLAQAEMKIFLKTEI